MKLLITIRIALAGVASATASWLRPTIGEAIQAGNITIEEAKAYLDRKASA